jgi:hypothetical protein
MTRIYTGSNIDDTASSWGGLEICFQMIQSGLVMALADCNPVVADKVEQFDGLSCRAASGSSSSFRAS